MISACLFATETALKLSSRGENAMELVVQPHYYCDLLIVGLADSCLPVQFADKERQLVHGICSVIRRCACSFSVCAESTRGG